MNHPNERLIDSLRQARGHAAVNLLRTLARQAATADDVDQWLILHRAVEGALNHANAWTRLSGISLAVTNEMVDLAGILARLAEHDSNLAVRLVALQALQYLGSDEEMPILSRLAQQPDRLGWQAHRALTVVSRRTALIAAA